MDDLFEGLDERMARIQGEASAGAPEEQLMAGVKAFVQLCAEDADLHRIMTVEGRSETDRLRWLVERHLRHNYQQTCELIRRGQEAGTVRAGDPTLLYYAFIAIAGTAFSLAPEIRLISRNDRAVDPDAITQLIRSLLLGG
jgi:TetR/AcrR family transcriptional regulator